MNVSYRWLRDLVPDLELSPDELAARLALLGAPVEGAVSLSEGMEDVVVARVEEVTEHPNADRLSLCRVHDGRESVQVVCGAPNVRAGRLYPLARVGASLPGGPTIRKAKIRGEESRGMLCSARELGLGADHTGILELPSGLEPGADLVEALGLDDVRMDVEVTANRGDLLSHVGVAREVAPGGVAGVRLPEVADGGGPADPTFERGGEEVRAEGVGIRIDDPELCPRYLGAVIRGVEVGPSPPWLASRLRAVGARPINNVVDATNYVLLELGQPLHAFDLDTLAGPEIVVRRAREGERIRTLDGEDRELGPGMLAICDASRPVAVAGVLGGEETEVGEGTKDVLLECALFEPTSIRNTRRALEVSTDASYRFERWVDPEGAERALLRAVEIVLAVAGGRLDGPILDAHPRPAEPVRTTLRPERVERVLGVPFGREALRELLEPLGFSLATEDGGAPDAAGELTVSVPGWRRRDVTREIDVIEEVARRHGYDRFPSELRPFPPGTVPDHPLFGLEDRLRTFLVGRGCWEAQNPSLVGSDAGEVALRNPVSARESHLRGSLLPSLLGNVEHNLARGVRDVRLFELGTVFLDSGEERPHEQTRVAVVLTGRRHPPHFSGSEEPVDLWDLKGLLGELVREIDRRGALRPGGPDDDPLLAPGASFTVEGADGAPVGSGGRVREGRVDLPAWAGPVWALELTLPAVPEPSTPPTVEDLPPFPGSERDLALLVPDGLEAERVRTTIEEAGVEHLEGVEIFDLYRGEGVPEGVRSIAFRLRFRSPERTLTDEEVEGATAALVRRLRDEHGVEPRGA